MPPSCSTCSAGVPAAVRESRPHPYDHRDSWQQGTRLRPDVIRHSAISLSAPEESERSLTNMLALAGWENFYVIVGSSAGALIGLQFVVITLIANRPVAKDEGQAGNAFATPTVVHFSTVLLLSAVGCAPWSGIGPVALIWTLFGLAGIVYDFVVVRRMRTQHLYKPVLEDWLFHAVLPLAAYAGLALAGFSSRLHERDALFGIAAASLLLLFIGIHNAWDAVTYHIFFVRGHDHHGSEPPH